jgi:hypothetical protein
LISLYNDEDKRFGVTYDNGILKDVERPLNPTSSYLLNKKKAEMSDGMLLPSSQI